MNKNELELKKLFKENDIRVFKIFCEELVAEILDRNGQRVVAVMRNKLMKNIFIDKEFGKMVFNANTVKFTVLKVDDIIEYLFNVDGKNIHVELGVLEETLVLQTLLFKN